jgi:hypothetical protein
MRTMLKVEICCRNCRRPTSRCVCASTGGFQTYTGILVGGLWKEIATDLEHLSTGAMCFEMGNRTLDGGAGKNFEIL